MQNVIGIRREDKNIWEKRVPLTPAQVATLVRDSNIRFKIQKSNIRIFPDDEYLKAGAELADEVNDCPVVLGIKEMPLDFFRSEKTYVFFAHVIKGQRHNMPMLRRMIELKCSLIDYEKITDEQGRRLIFFGRFAGIAGMIDTLAGLGKRLSIFGYQTPLADVKLAYEYEWMEVAKSAIRLVGEKVKEVGLPIEVAPLIIGLTGYGNVGSGAKEILAELGTVEVAPNDLPEIIKNKSTKQIFSTVFKEEDMVEPRLAGHRFNLEEYYHQPDLYRSKFENYLLYLSVLVNCIYWDARYPRLVTKEYLKRTFASGPNRLLIIGDISCDVNGSVEATVKATNPGAPFFVYQPFTEQAVDGIHGEGVVIMAIDNLPCELASDASEEFGNALFPFVPILAQTDFHRSIDELDLNPPLRRALILHQGKLTPEFNYIEQFL